MRLSVIIPCYNDAAALRDCLVGLVKHSPEVEIIVADASDTPECFELAESMGAVAVHCSRRGRGPQMNAGAAVATGEILIFNHCDTTLEIRHLDAIRQCLRFGHPPTLAGAFYKSTPHHYPILAWAHSFIRFWVREWGVIYGDQTMFFRRDHFQKLGGFPAIPLMEDVAMSQIMRAAGGLQFLDPPVETSLRRFQRLGYLRTRLLNFLLVWLFKLGVPAEKLYRWYYGRRD